MNSKGKKSQINLPAEGQIPSDQEGRTVAVLAHFEDSRAFYQAQTLTYSHWYIGLTVATLVGTAVTPILLLIDFGTAWKFIPALPSAIAGLAAAMNAAMRYRESWAQNYYTLSALINEHQKFIARASPEYGLDKNENEVVDKFQNNISKYVMSEVESWRAVMLTSETGHHSNEEGRTEGKGA